MKLIMAFICLLFFWVWATLYTEPTVPGRKRNLKTAPKAPAIKPASPSELPRLVSVLKSLLGLTTKESQILFEVVTKMSALFHKSGVKHTISYYSEVLRLIFEYLSGRGLRQHKTWVKVSRSGLPKIIGEDMIKFITSYRTKIIQRDYDLIRDDRRFLLFRALITVVSFFRTMSPTHVIKFDSVTSPFTGSGTLSKDEIVAGLKSLGITTLKLKSPRFFWSNKAGVNSSFAFLSIGLDFLGIIGHPSVWFSHLIYAIKMRYYLYVFIFIMMTIWCLPFFLLSFPIHGIFPLGRLTIVKELRGKARVVGITDYWTQILFKPLHDSIYLSLSKTLWDGTMDQLGPIYTLLETNPRHVVSVDLTAATDRLPVTLQADILDALGIPGQEWLSILDRPYVYEDVPMKYAVGQPMGAYSSFAMLALTNHLIMHCAALQANTTLGPGSYAILGDDVAIQGNLVAVPYIKILNMLGVEVNPIKGFDGKVLEFAKNIFTIGGNNLSPIGGKSLLHASRQPIFLPTLLSDMGKKDYFKILKPELTMFTNYLENLFGKKGLSQFKWLFCFLGPQSGYYGTSPEGNQAFFELFETLFENVLSKLDYGIICNRKNVQIYFEHALQRKMIYTVASLMGAGESVARAWHFSMKPYLWSQKKFQNLITQTPENTATLSMASASVVLFPVLAWYFFSAFAYGLLLLIGSKIIGKTKADTYLIRYLKNPFYLLWNLYSEFRMYGNKGWFKFCIYLYILRRDSLLDNRANIHENAWFFHHWAKSVHMSKPMQLLNTRFTTMKPWELEGDCLPAVKTAEKCLSSLSPTMRSYLSSTYRIQRLQYQLKTKGTNNKRGKPLKQG